jgi:hypothetical protein
MNRFVFALSAVTLSLTAAACGGEPVGRICDLGQEVDEGTNIVATESLDCTTRTCLKVRQEVLELPPGSRYPTGNKGLCTAKCESSDDCERVPESPCQLGFTCGVATTVGSFCCEKVCICKDYIVLPEDGSDLEVPIECDPDNADNVCCNLEGRTGNADYPNCPG